MWYCTWMQGYNGTDPAKEAAAADATATAAQLAAAAAKAAAKTVVPIQYGLQNTQSVVSPPLFFCPH